MRERVAFFVGLGLLITGPYFANQRMAVFPDAVMPEWWIDRMFPFVPEAAVLYVSLYVFLCVPLVWIRDPVRLRRVAFGIGILTVISHVLFFFWPTSIAPSLVPAGRSTALLDTILSQDGLRNACPSLHASLAVYTALALGSLFGWIWAVLIVVSTLLIKRHVAVDLVAGALLGWVVYQALFRRVAGEPERCRALEDTLEVRSALATQIRDQLPALTRLSLGNRLLELMLFAVIVGAGMQLTSWHAAGVIVTAVGLNGLVLLMHDGMHGTLFRNPFANWLGSVLLGTTFLMSFSSYRVMHNRHHNYLGDERDPDDYHNYTQQQWLVWFLHFVRLTMGSLLYLGLIPYLALKHGSWRERRLILVEYTILLATYSALFRFVPAGILVLYWLVPLLLTGMMVSLRGFTQHGITGAKDPYIASRTMLPHPLVRLLLLNENLHLEHHLFPEVPSYHLPQLHALIWPKLPRAVAGRSYLRFLLEFLKATPRMDETPIGLVHPAESSK